MLDVESLHGVSAELFSSSLSFIHRAVLDRSAHSLRDAIFPLSGSGDNQRTFATNIKCHRYVTFLEEANLVVDTLSH